MDEIRNSPIYTNNIIPIRLIASGFDIWDHNATTHLLQFADIYRFNISAFPTNSQFTERGVKESGYVTLGRRTKKNRSALAIARAKIIPDAMAAGKKVIDRGDGKKRSVQRKLRAKMLIDEAIMHQSIINKMLSQDRQLLVAQSKIHNDLTLDERQLKNKELTKR